MFIINVSVVGNGPAVIAALQAITADKRGILDVLGKAAANELKRHFNLLENTHQNKLGGRRTHFWGGVSSSVAVPRITGADNITVAIGSVLLPWKISGGDIYPKNVQWLTIPVIAEAYALKAREYEEISGKTLGFFKKSEETAFLADVELKIGPRGGKQKTFVRLVFVLKKHVHQDPMPDAMPEDKDWQTALGQTATQYVNMISGRAAIQG